MNHQSGEGGAGRRTVAKRWTAEEDAALREVVLQSGEEAISWVDVSKHLPGRTNKDSRRRWTKIKDTFKRGIWSREEDESLRVAVERFGQRWALVTEMVETRSPDQCQKRWRNAIDPKISGTVSWSSEEDQLLRDAVSEMGKNWSQISDHYFPNRSPLSLSNRYTGFEQHSNSTSVSTREPQSEPANSPAAEMDSGAPHVQNNVSMTNGTTRFLEMSNALDAPPITDFIDNSHFNELISGSDLPFTWRDTSNVRIDNNLLTPELRSAYNVENTQPQDCASSQVNIPSSNTSVVSPKLQTAKPSTSTLPSQEVPSVPPSLSQASSCVQPFELPSDAASSVLILENIDDETRDAVLRLVWSKRRRTTLRLE